MPPVNEMISITGIPVKQEDVQQPTVEETHTVDVAQANTQQVDDSSSSTDDNLPEIKLDDFLKAASGDNSSTDKKDVSDKKEMSDEDFKEDDNTIVKPVVDNNIKAKEVDKTIDKVIEKKTTRKDLVTQDLKTRDLSGLDEELAPLFKDKMSRSTFDKLKPIVLEHKQLKIERDTIAKELEELKKDSLPANYYENDKGFLLSPEFEQYSSQLNDAETIYNHWKTQLAELEDGADEISTIDYNANKQLVIAGKIKATKDVERQLREQVSIAQHQVFEYRNKAQQYVSKFKETASSANNWLKDFEDKAFSYFDTESGKQHIGAVNALKNQLPRILASSKLADPFVKSLFLNQAANNVIVQLKARIAELEKGGSAAVTKTVTTATSQRKAGPTASDSGASSAKEDGSSSEITIDMFNAIKES